MFTKKYIISICFAILMANSSIYAQNIAAKPATVDSLHRLDIAPSTISIVGKLYEKPNISVSESGNLGASPVLMIRGLNSINLSSSPLIYIDGIPMRYSGANPTFLSTFEPDRLGFLNPNDINNIQVLSSGFEMPKIGGRGSNGILEIHTERGEFGGTKVDFIANYGLISSNLNVPRLDAQSMKAYLWSRFQEEGMSPAQLDQHPIFSESNPKYNFQNDWLNMIKRDGVFQDYHLKLKGGDGDANYLFAVGYTNKEGLIKETNFERIGLRFNLDYQLAPNISIYNNLSYTNTSGHYKEFGSDYNTHPIYIASAKAPFLGTNFVNADGSQSRILASVDTLGLSNPLALVNNLSNKNQFNRIDGVMGVNWKIRGAWDLKSDLSISYFNLSEKQFRPALGIVPDLYRIRQNSQRSSSEFYLNWNGILSNSGKLSENLKYNTSIQAAIETYEEKSVFGRKINAGTDDFETLQQGVVDSASNTRYRSNLMSYIAEGILHWNERISLNASLNVQGSSNFGSNSRWNIYPGAKVYFYILEEKPLNKWSINLGYNRTGNHEVRGFYHFNQYYPENYFGYGGVYFGNIANPSLRPEITDNYDIQSIITPFGNRLQLNLGYYFKHTTNLITHKTILNELGLQDRFENAGSITNQGLELGLTSQIIAKENIAWNLSTSVSTLKNKVTSLPNGAIEQSIGNITGIAKEGEQLGSYYGYRVLGVFQNESEVNLKKSDGTVYHPGDYVIEDINNDGIINSLDKQIIGTGLPKFFGYFSTTFQYKNFGLNLLFNFSQGADIYNSFKQQMHLMKDFANQDPSVLNRWRSDDETGNGLSRAVLDDPSNNGASSSLWVEDGSYLKLKQSSLHYNIKGKPSQFFKNIMIYLSADNLITWTKYSGFDPEVNGLNISLLRNIDFGAPPLGKTFKLGLKTSF